MKEVKEDYEGWPSSFLQKWATKSGGGSSPAFHFPLLQLPKRFEDFIVGFYECRTNRRGRISRSGSAISKWRVYRGSGGKHDSSYRWSFSGIDVGYVPRMAPLIVQIWTRSGFDEIEEFLGCLKDFQELYTTFSTLAGKLWWRGRSWVFELNKSDLCPSFIEGLTAKDLRPSRGGLRYW
ncbi:hypothetical protein Tco_0695614 [Tanacetum coccineum]